MDDDLFTTSNDEEYLTRVVIDISSRKFRLYSSEGEIREVDCDTSEEFMSILEFIRDFQESGLLDEDTVVYAEPLEVQ